MTHDEFIAFLKERRFRHAYQVDLQEPGSGAYDDRDWWVGPDKQITVCTPTSQPRGQGYVLRTADENLVSPVYNTPDELMPALMTACLTGEIDGATRQGKL